MYCQFARTLLLRVKKLLKIPILASPMANATASLHCGLALLLPCEDRVFAFAGSKGSTRSARALDEPFSSLLSGGSLASLMPKGSTRFAPVKLKHYVPLVQREASLVPLEHFA